MSNSDMYTNTVIADVSSLETLVDYLNFNFGYSFDYIADNYIPKALNRIVGLKIGQEGVHLTMLHIKNRKNLPSNGRYLINFTDNEAFTLFKLYYA